MKSPQAAQAARDIQALYRQRKLYNISRRRRSFKAQETALQGIHDQYPAGSMGSPVDRELTLDVASCLTETEAEIFRLIQEAVTTTESKTVVRVAGGWVRDKLLGLENEDIDIAVDNSTGVAFANLVNVHLKYLGREESRVATIEANPDQSKHLETARMKMMGMWIDVVNLRTETYKSDSRIPEASFGTAEEDALRRDFTLNALFYNIHTRSIEDLTGRGIDDLREGIIRTPLSPMITFQDDPLRVLRAIRFASRFDFSLHEDLQKAARDSKIQAALETKVSRERIGAELSGMLTGKMARPALALSLIHELGLSQAVFAPPENRTPSSLTDGYDWNRGVAVARAAARILTNRASVNAVEASKLSQEARSAETATDMKCPREGGTPAEGTLNGGLDPISSDVLRDVMDVELGDNEHASDEKQKAKDQPDSAVFDGDAACSDLKTTGQATSKGTGSFQAKGKGKGKGKTLPIVSLEANKDSRVSETKVVIEPQTLVRELFLSAALVPLMGLQHRVKKGKFIPAAQAVVQESLKLKAKEAKNVADVLDAVSTFGALVNIYASASRVTSGADGDKAALPRLDIGLAIRQVKELWPTCIDLCCAIEICDAQKEKQKNSGDIAVRKHAVGGIDGEHPVEKRAKFEGNGGERGSEDVTGEAVITKYTEFERAVRRAGLGKAWSIAPVVGGNDVMKTLGVPKGPEVGKIMAQQVRWQLEHPDGTREECISYLGGTLEEKG